MLLVGSNQLPPCRHGRHMAYFRILLPAGGSIVVRVPKGYRYGACGHAFRNGAFGS